MLWGCGEGCEEPLAHVELSWPSPMQTSPIQTLRHEQQLSYGLRRERPWEVKSQPVARVWQRHLRDLLQVKISISRFCA